VGATVSIGFKWFLGKGLRIMFKLIRKIGVGAVVVAGGLMVLSWLGLSSYPATAMEKVRNSFKKQVPLEFEVERLRYLVTQLVPDMKKNLGNIAEMMVSLDNLRDDVADSRTNLKRQKDQVLAMTKELETGTTTVLYRGKEWGATQLREKLDNDFAAYQQAEAELKTKELLLEAKEREVAAAREQMASIKKQKQEMEIELARLEAEIRTVRAAQSRSKFQIDNSSLAKCKATLADLRNRLKIERTTTQLQGEFGGDDDVVVQKKGKSSKELTRQIKSYFNEPATSEGKVAADQK
jgi:chromosome segregation ATPase